MCGFVGVLCVVDVVFVEVGLFDLVKGYLG